MNLRHEYASRIDANLWNDIVKIKELEGNVNSINSYINLGLKYVKENKLEQITKARKQRNTLAAMTQW
jgi:hypothetical protein|tara:strand:- start:53 stop:256 length:204 start_codon:yes stop_codon:yes gene_type:complete